MLETRLNPREPIEDIKDNNRFIRYTLRDRALALLERYAPEHRDIRDEVLGGYFLLFQNLVKLPRERTKLIFSDFFAGFPNGEDLTGYLDRLYKIDWLNPKKVYTNRELQPYIDEINAAFKLRLNDVKKIEVIQDYNTALQVHYEPNSMPSSVIQATMTAAGQNNLTIAWGAVYHGTIAFMSALTSNVTSNLDIGNEFIFHAAEGAAFTMLKDSPGRPCIKDNYEINACEKLLDVDELGLWLAGVTGRWDNRRLVVWHPPVKNKIEIF